jgi:hypothetical protein
MCQELPQRLLSDTEIKERREDNHVDQDQVVVTIDNQTSFLPDIVFRPLFADDETSLRLSGQACFPLPAMLNRKCVSKHKSVFTVSRAVGSIFISFNSEIPEKPFYEGAWYKNKYMNITIHRRDADPSIQFSSEDPYPSKP